MSRRNAIITLGITTHHRGQRQPIFWSMPVDWVVISKYSDDDSLTLPHNSTCIHTFTVSQNQTSTDVRQASFRWRLPSQKFITNARNVINVTACTIHGTHSISIFRLTPYLIQQVYHSDYCCFNWSKVITGLSLCHSIQVIGPSPLFTTVEDGSLPRLTYWGPVDIYSKFQIHGCQTLSSTAGSGGYQECLFRNTHTSDKSWKLSKLSHNLVEFSIPFKAGSHANVKNKVNFPNFV